MFSFESLPTPGNIPFPNPMALPYFNYPNILFPTLDPYLFLGPQPSYQFPTSQCVKQEQQEQDLLKPQKTKKSTLSSQIKKKVVPKKVYPKTKDPFRNIYTNLTNLVMNFIVCQKKIGKILFKVDQTFVDSKLSEFCKYVKNFRSRFSAYYNPQKLKKLFNGHQVPIYNEYFHKMFRIAVRIVLEEKITLCLITSKRLSPYLTLQHLKYRREMLGILLGRSETSCNISDRLQRPLVD